MEAYTHHNQKEGEMSPMASRGRANTSSTAVDTSLFPEDTVVLYGPFLENFLEPCDVSEDDVTLGERTVLSY